MKMQYIINVKEMIKLKLIKIVIPKRLRVLKQNSQLKE